MADHAYALRTASGFVHALVSHGTTTALVFGAHFAPATAALFEAAESAGLRIAAGQVLSDRLLRPELHQTPDRAYHESKLVDRALPSARALDLRRHAALCPFHFRGHAGSLPDAAARTLTAFCFKRTSTKMFKRSRRWRACFPGLPITWRSTKSSACAVRTPIMAHRRSSHRFRTGAPGSERRHGRRTAHRATPLSAAASFRCGATSTPACDARLEPTSEPAPASGCSRKDCRRILLQRLAPDGMLLDAGHLLYLATLAGAEALGLGDETGDFRAGKSADFVYLRPPADSPLAAVLEREQTPERVLAAIFTLAGAESVREVRVEGSVVYRCAAEEP